MRSNCIFCKITAGQVDADILYRDDLVTAFRDIHPIAPTHVLIVPNEHRESVNELNADDGKLLARLFSVAGMIAEQEEVQQSGYRVLTNSGPDSGQAIFHLHFHVIGGRPLRSMG